MSSEETDQAIELMTLALNQIWRYRKLLNMLAQSRGAGTSCITLILPPRTQISQWSGMLTAEYGTASNIKSRVNRLSVLSAITSTQQKLKLFNRVPDNGLCVFVGTVLNEEGKEKKISFALTPFKPINTSLYLCDSRFHVEALAELLESDSKWGFIIIDGNGSLFGTLSGNTREIVHKFTVDLPKKHGRGGQSALRFSRLREEARRNYVRKVAELAVQHFITNDKVNVAGLVLAGSAELKTDLSGSDLFDPRLLAKVVKVVDVSYGGENGFNQAIELAADSLANVKFVQEKRLIQKYFDEIALDTGKYCFGITDTLKALDMGAVETLIVWENLEITRNILRNAAGEEIIVHSTPTDKDRDKFMDKATGLEMEIAAEAQPLLEWFAEKYKDFGATLEFVTNKSQEGSQFVKGFGGIGGVMRYKVDFTDLGDLDDGDDEFYGSDADSGAPSPLNAPLSAVLREGQVGGEAAQPGDADQQCDWTCPSMEESRGAEEAESIPSDGNWFPVTMILWVFLDRGSEEVMVAEGLDRGSLLIERGLAVHSGHSFANSSGMVSPDYGMPMRQVIRADSERQAGSRNSAQQLHRHEVTVSTSLANRESFVPYDPASVEISPLPSLAHSFASSHALEFERGAGHQSFDDALKEASMHKVDIAKHQSFQPRIAAMSRDDSGGGIKIIKWRSKVFPSSIPCRLLLLTVILESLVDLSIEGNILWRFNVEVTSSNSTELELENKRRLPIYLIIFGLAHLWQLFLTVIAIRTRNTVQVIALTIFNFAFLGYAIIEARSSAPISELREILGDNLADSLDKGPSEAKTLLTLPLNVLTAVVIAVITICCLVLLVLAYFIRREFGWERYRFLGADLRIRKLYFRFQIFECICYFSAFFCAGFSIQLIWLVLQTNDVEYIITCIAFPISVILIIIGRFAAKFENRPCMGVFMIGLLGGCAYFIFKLIRIWQQRSTTYVALTKSLTTFDALSLVSLISCLVSGGIVWMDFGKGLKEAFLSQPGASSLLSVARLWRIGSGGSLVVESEMNTAPRRISID
ncbi:MAG: Polypeptide release factor (eRF1) in translation termination [Tremellales sp. Tagirdzhanova-0007]|nr:MAG: Polypeptide release factor (eRF1) in translation termination [Tremellales sp. Tagirdzhanova-0007]